LARKTKAINDRLTWRKSFNKYKLLYLMLIPGVLWYVLFKYAPMFGIVMAFQNYKVTSGVFGSEWVNLQNFVTLFTGDEFLNALKNTVIIGLLKLTIGSILLTIVFGVTFGVISAMKRNTPLDAVLSIGALTLTSIPSFWLGLILMLIFSLKLGWVSSLGSDSLKNFILPCITLSAASVGSVVRMTRSSVLEVIGQDYVRTAHAKGLKDFKITMGHILRNSLLPIITTIGLNFAGLMGGAVVTENVFGMSGIGTLLVNSVASRDTPLIMGCVIFIASVICLTNLAVDIIYTFVDPRLRVKG